MLKSIARADSANDRVASDRFVTSNSTQRGHMYVKTKVVAKAYLNRPSPMNKMTTFY